LPENTGAYPHVLSAIDNASRSLSVSKVYAAATLCFAAYERDPAAYFRTKRHEFRLLRASNANSGDNLVFVIAEDRNDIVYCAVRGTQSWSNWQANLNVRSSLNIPSRSGLVHKGFLDYARSLPLADLELLHTAGKTIVFCGHSMGGAVATLGMLLLISIVSEKTRLQSITFGAPMFCDDTFLQELRGLGPGLLGQERLITNFVAEKDIVPIILRKCDVLRDTILSALPTAPILTVLLKCLVEPADAASSLLSLGTDISLSVIAPQQIAESVKPVLLQIVQTVLPTYVACGEMIVISAAAMSMEEYLESASTFAFPQSFQQHTMLYYLNAVVSACEAELQVILPENSSILQAFRWAMTESHDVATERFFVPRLEDKALLTCGIIETKLLPGIAKATRTIRVQLWGEYLGLVLPPVNNPSLQVVQFSDSHTVEAIEVRTHSSTCMMLDIFATGPVHTIPTSLQLNLQSRVPLRPDGHPTLGCLELPIAVNFFQNRDARIRNGSFSQLLSEVVLLVLLSKRASPEKSPDAHLDSICNFLQELDAKVETACLKAGAVPVVAAFHHLSLNGVFSRERDFAAELVTALAEEEIPRKMALKRLVADMCMLIGIDPLSKEIAEFKLIGSATRVRRLMQSSAASLKTFDIQSIGRDIFQNEVAFLCFLSMMKESILEDARGHAQNGVNRMLISMAVAVLAGFAFFACPPLIAIPAAAIGIVGGAAVSAALSEYRSASVLMGIRLLMFLSEDVLCEFLHPSEPGQGQSNSLLDREKKLLRFFSNRGEVEAHWGTFVGESLKPLTPARRQAVAETFVSVLNPLVQIREETIKSKMFAVIVVGQPGAGKSRLVEDLFGLEWQRKTTVITPHALSRELVVFDFPGANDNAELSQSMIGEQAKHVQLGDMLVFLFKLDERSSAIKEILKLRRLDKPMLFCLTCVDEFFLRRIKDHLGDGLSEGEAIASALSAISAKVNEFCTLFGVNKQSVRLMCPARGAWDAKTTRLAPGYPEDLKTSGLVSDTFPVYEEICHQVQRAGFFTQVVDEALREGLKHSYPARLAATG